MMAFMVQYMEAGRRPPAVACRLPFSSMIEAVCTGILLFDKAYTVGGFLRISNRVTNGDDEMDGSKEIDLWQRFLEN